jgi:hypothetical protein
MAVPSYTTDLATISDAAAKASWDELGDWGGGGTVYDETDYYIQGSQCISQICTKTGAQDITSLVVDYGSDLGAGGADAFTAGETCVFMWHVFLPANALDVFNNGGTRLVVAADLNEFDAWKVGGKDFGRNPYGGWQNVAIDPSFPPDYQDDGAVGNAGVYQWFGSGLYLLAAIGKGAPHGVDYIRYGRGSLIVSGGEAANYATFTGMSAENDDPNLRWGLFQEEGTGYLWKGLMSLGVSSPAHPVDFRDTNINITIDDTPRTYESFNRIEVKNAGSKVYWTGVNMNSLEPSGLSIGQFEAIDDADIQLTNCVFTDTSTWIFQSNSVLNTTTWRRSGQVTQGGGDFDDCIFDSSPAEASIYVSNLDNIDGCDFTSDGLNHAIQLSNAHAGNEYTLTDCTYNNYAGSDGDTGNECIYNDSGGAVTINIIGGDTPTVRNGASASTILVINPVVLQLTVTDITTTNPISGARCLVTVGTSANFPWHADVDITGAGTTATVAHLGHGYSTGENVLIEGAETASDVYNGAYEIIVTGVDAYTYQTSEAIAVTPAVGTITATTALINEKTDEFGVVSDTRSYNNNQPVSGRVRMSTSSPYYQQSPVTDEVDKTAGKSINVQMIKDE